MVGEEGDVRLAVTSDKDKFDPVVVRALLAASRMASLVSGSGMGAASSMMISLLLLVQPGLTRLAALGFGCCFLVGVPHSR